MARAPNEPRSGVKAAPSVPAYGGAEQMEIMTSFLKDFRAGKVLHNQGRLTNAMSDLLLRSAANRLAEEHNKDSNLPPRSQSDLRRGSDDKDSSLLPGKNDKPE